MKANSFKMLLVVEDNLGDARLFREMFNEQGSHDTRMTLVGCMGEAEQYLSEHVVDIILLDLGLPDANGLEAVRRAHSAAPSVPLVVLTGTEDASLAAQALQEGAQDYLIKGQIETRGLLRALRYAVERKNMEEALFAEKERAQVTLNSIGDAVVCTDVAGNISFLNRVAEVMTGWSWCEAAGRPVNDVLHVLDATTPAANRDSMEREGEPQMAECVSHCILVRRDGFEIPIEETVAPIHDRKGDVIGTVVVFRDVSVARAMATKMDHSAKHDFLTGLPNRMLLSDRINQAVALAPRHAKSVVVLFLDLDGFKLINDTLGHALGDKLLQSVASRLVECVRGSDTVSRQGGDEFVVLLAEVERSEDATATATRMLNAVAEPHYIDGHELRVTTSIGVSVYPDDGLDSGTLIRNADTAMYQAKEDGRQSYRFFRPAMNVRATERQFIEESLRRSLERQEFELHYQPRINLTTGEIVGAEALLRWTHPSRGALTPSQFIHVAEDCGLIVPIGRWVLRKACEQGRAWALAGGPRVTVSVNVSATEFRDKGFLDGVLATLAETELDPHSLELELTESVLMKSVESTASILQTLRESGVRVAIDDFGTGYSSLGYLRQFPVDALKIDQSFIRQITVGGEDTAIVTAVINMARSLRLRVIAEGVEELEELEFLQANQCDEAQGFHICRPVTGSEFLRMIVDGYRIQPPTRYKVTP